MVKAGLCWRSFSLVQLNGLVISWYNPPRPKSSWFYFFFQPLLPLSHVCVQIPVRALRLVEAVGCAPSGSGGGGTDGRPPAPRASVRGAEPAAGGDAPRGSRRTPRLGSASGQAAGKAAAEGLFVAVLGRTGPPCSQCIVVRGCGQRWQRACSMEVGGVCLLGP